MKSAILFVAASLVLGLSTAQAGSEDAKSLIQSGQQSPPVKERLLSSAWEGTFTSLAFSALEGVSSPIRLVFLPELNAKGELQYFHRLTGAVASEVLAADDACRLTPRALSMQPVSGS